MDVGEFFMMAHGFGRHIWTLTPEKIENAVKVSPVPVYTPVGVCFDNTTFRWAYSVWAINIATDLGFGTANSPAVEAVVGKENENLLLVFRVGVVITVISIIRFSGCVTYSSTSNPSFNNVNVAT
ncbi:hypothetical protein VTI74DRAFT_3492 [Chaetomium olivicolor]